MKIGLKALIIGLVSSLCSGGFQFNAAADVAVSLGVQISATAEFHAPLEPHGAWVEVGSYGRCWRPAHVAVGWRPYCDGHWVWTDVGWYWESDEPWAWATYHYGSWAFEPEFGWVWVPGIEWAPAWVYWRIGDGYCGWAPYSPRGVVIAPSLFVFVEAGHFHERVRPSTVIVNNTTIINKTTQITTINRETRDIGGTKQKVVINEGPSVAMVEKATSKKISPVPIQEAARQTPVPSQMKSKIKEPAGVQKEPTIKEDRKEDRKSKTEGKTLSTEVVEPRATPPAEPRVAPPVEKTEPRQDRPTVEPRAPSPNRGNAPSKREVIPPSRPPVSPDSPDKPTGLPEEKEKGRGHDKDKPRS